MSALHRTRVFIPFFAASVLAGSLASAQRPALAAPCSVDASGDIGAEWSKLGGADGPLGCPTQPQQSAVIDLSQNFQHGQIVTSPNLGPHATLTVYVDSARELNVVWDSFSGNPGELWIGTRTNPSSYLAPFSYKVVAYTPQGSAKFPITGNEDAEILACPKPLRFQEKIPSCAPSTTNMAGIDSASLAMAPPPATLLPGAPIDLTATQSPEQCLEHDGGSVCNHLPNEAPNTTVLVWSADQYVAQSYSIYQRLAGATTFRFLKANSTLSGGKLPTAMNVTRTPGACYTVTATVYGTESAQSAPACPVPASSL
jgi:hypothetical protein